MHLTRSRVAALAATGALTATLGLTAAAPADAATTAASTSCNPSSSCDHQPWERAVQGSPGKLSGDRSGDYLWHDGDGFHLRVTHAHGDRRVYTGTITASAPMRYTPTRLEKGDIVKLSHDRRTLSFSFTNYGAIDGADFHTDCAATLTVSGLHVGNADLGRDHVYLGEKKVHPAHVPFTVHRV